VPQNRAGIGIEVCLCGRDPIEPLEKRSLQFTNARPQYITCGFDSWPCIIVLKCFETYILTSPVELRVQILLSARRIDIFELYHHLGRFFDFQLGLFSTVSDWISEDALVVLCQIRLFAGFRLSFGKYIT
jgi:hypothetical protein